jgi:hypothetical protein
LNVVEVLYPIVQTCSRHLVVAGLLPFLIDGVESVNHVAIGGGALAYVRVWRGWCGRKVEMPCFDVCGQELWREWEARW